MANIPYPDEILGEYFPDCRVERDPYSDSYFIEKRIGDQKFQYRLDERDFRIANNIKPILEYTKRAIDEQAKELFYQQYQADLAQQTAEQYQYQQRMRTPIPVKEPEPFLYMDHTDIEPKKKNDWLEDKSLRRFE